MGSERKITNWLERHWVTPAYAGWLLGFLTVFFFGAATNTMAGWLYVISGMGLALLLAAAILPGRSLSPLQVRRYPITPVSVGDHLTFELEIENQSTKSCPLFQIYDRLPTELATASESIDVIGPRQVYHWKYSRITKRRGIYHWSGVRLRSASPLGLFWCSRDRQVPATAIVYPTVLPLTACPIIQSMEVDQGQEIYERDRLHQATEGITRTLRPYRIGDPTRLIHWRSSARYGDLRVRELEVAIGGQDVVICLDSAFSWDPADFETAVSVAASLYFYAHRSQFNARLWTPSEGLVQGNWGVLSVLAGVMPGVGASSNVSPLSHQKTTEQAPTPPDVPLIWITQNSDSLMSLSPQSRWLLWPAPTKNDQGDRTPPSPPCPGLMINPAEPLVPQLQLKTSIPMGNRNRGY
ncbi:MAG: DUF58 domain-containing protein [Arthrospira sp. SH-MAG29]|nr:DUF58 domain-containing protein [Arthrospira sp. SH-MAG29]MBS0018270.1 DUF58 domain-containing protein [Arthrospira sp. SH-MAG29]